MRGIDLSSLPLTQKEVDIYRELYYESYKPLIKELEITGDPKEDSLFMVKFQPKLDFYNWNYRLFEAYKSIDLMQRIVFDLSLNNPQSLKPYPEYSHLDPNNGALRLKCPNRTEDPDPLAH